MKLITEERKESARSWGGQHYTSGAGGESHRGICLFFLGGTKKGVTQQAVWGLGAGRAVGKRGRKETGV